jgi:hypothetical protein
LVPKALRLVQQRPVIRVAVTEDHRAVAIRRPPVGDADSVSPRDLAEHALRDIHAVMADQDLGLERLNRALADD